MKITSVTPLTATFAFERDPLSYSFVRIETDEGLVGYGEACDSYGCTYANVVATVIDDALAPLLVGEELDSVERLAEKLRLHTRRRLGDQCIAPMARSATEIALWDLTARAADRSVSALIGQVRDRVPVYASSVFLEEGPATWHAELLQPLLEQGVTMVKLRVGPEWRADLATLTELRGLLDPGVEIMIDGSEIFTLPTATEVARQLGELGVMWFEEPIPQNERAGIEDLVSRSPVAIAYGEHLYSSLDALEALQRRQATVLQPDASTCGGIGEARRMAAGAAYFGARVVPHVCAGPISLAANLAVAATVGQIRAIEYPYTMAPAWDAFGTGPRLGPDAIVDGTIAVPDGPGLGVALDEAAVAAHPYRPPGTRVAGTRGGLPDRFVGDR
ncbi:MAG: mandelate racemase/muconate lactonizing enzyme family protein [Actinomycetota bacterium]|nr:mandelate racemase/muconate lactonizing enzyme family protein [Actinomycetota bacterium]